MPLILGTNSIKDTGYDVANSVRLNAGDNPSGTITQGTPTNVDKYTFSVWVKRADIGAGNSKIFSVQGSNANVEEKLEFNNDDIIWRQTEASAGNTTWERVTDRKFRDPSAWYHIVVAYDSSQGTAGDRCKMYINGVQETSFSGSSDPSSNLDSVTNTSGRALKFFASCFNVNNQNAGAYFAEMVYVDGQQLDPTSFGEFDSDSPNIWKPIDVSGLTFGNNGFYLDFEDSSALGNDVSGNNNDVTFSNIASTDQSTDTCTNNAPTMNILSSSTTPIFSQGNLEIQCNNLNSWNKVAPATFVLHSGKWYWEIKNLDSTYPNYINPAFMNANYYSNSISGSGFPGNVYDSNNGFWNGLQGGGDNVNYSIYRAGSSGSTISSAFLVNHIMSFALDLDNRKCWLAHNGSYVLSGNPSTGVNETWGTSDIDADTPYVPAVAYYYNSSKIGFNFGSPSQSISSGNSDANGYGNFEYAVPTGFYAINSKNLAEYG